MTLTLVRKLLRDVRPALVVVCVLLFLFAALWVKVAQRVTTEISPFFNVIAKVASPRLNPKVIEEVLFRGPGKVSQAVMGGADMRFEQPADFLAAGLLHPVVLILASVWAVGRAAGAVAGELDRGTMELLLSQPVPRNRLIAAHLLVDAVTLPVVALSFYAGTEAGLALVGPFVIDYSLLPDQLLKLMGGAPPPESIAVSGRPELLAVVNLVALMFAVSGLTVAASAAGRSRWKVTGLSMVVVVVMFAVNVLGQLWDAAAFLRPLTVFFYYQPQKVMLKDDWTTDLGSAWTADGHSLLAVPVVVVLFAVGAVGYGVALRVFTRRDLPAPL